jgi:TonB C terminal
MKSPSYLLSIVALGVCSIAAAHAQTSASASAPQSSDLQLGVDLLSNTGGANLDLYLKHLSADIKQHWLPSFNQGANLPPFQQSDVSIRLTILPDGSISAMHLEGSSHDVAIDKAAWGSITSEGQFQPLPKSFHEQNLELRLHFTVN